MRLEGKRILVTGAHGRLGKELVPLLRKEGARVMAPSRKEWDVSAFPCGLAMPEDPDVMIHAAAYTNVAGSEVEKDECRLTNVDGTLSVAKLAKQTKAKLVYISSDYVDVHPMGFYAFTKKAGESFVDKNKGLIIRTSFKPRGLWGENKLEGVFHPVYTNADWVDVIASKVVDVVCSDLTGMVNVGTSPKTLKDLAIQEYPEVEEIPVEEADELLGYIYPRDTTMELTI